MLAASLTDLFFNLSFSYMPAKDSLSKNNYAQKETLNWRAPLFQLPLATLTVPSPTLPIPDVICRSDTSSPWMLATKQSRR